MKIIAICNSKGGVGKTTCTINIGAGLALMKKKVLLIDLDPHAHLTYSIGLEKSKIENTVYKILINDIDPNTAIISRNGVDVIPSSISLCKADQYLSSIPCGECVLRESLKKVSGYDYVFIDCPPSLNHLTLNALTAAHEVYIPLQANSMSMRGMQDLLQTIEIVKKHLNTELEISGIIGTFIRRTVLNKGAMEVIKEHFQNKVFKTIIRQNIALEEAPSHGKTIFEYRLSSNGAKDYNSLCKEILKRSKGNDRSDGRKEKKARKRS